MAVSSVGVRMGLVTDCIIETCRGVGSNFAVSSLSTSITSFTHACPRALEEFVGKARGGLGLKRGLRAP